jgi:hypothetical protein
MSEKSRYIGSYPVIMVVIVEVSIEIEIGFMI